jgi:hypothetical protein
MLFVALGLGETLLDTGALYRAVLGAVSFARVVSSNSIGALVNLALPYDAGEVVKAVLLRRASHAPPVLAGLVVWNYVWKASKPVSAAVAFLAALAFGSAVPRSVLGLVFAGVALSFVPYAGMNLILRLGPAERGSRMLVRLPFVGAMTGRWIASAAQLDREVREFSRDHGRDWLVVFALQVAGRCVQFIALAVIMRWLALPHGAADTAWIALAPPVFTTGCPGRYGARCAATAMGPIPGPPPPCGMQKVLCRFRWQTSAPKSPGRAMPTSAFRLAPSR